MTQLTLNEKTIDVDVEPEMPLLWLLRNELDLTATKFGCGMALCGACTVHVDGVPTRSCVLPVSAVGARKVTTLEGLQGPVADAVRKAWIELDVVQCGYCQPGQVMAAAGLLRTNRSPTDEDIDTALSGNLCRCGTYPRIRAAVHHAAQLLRA